MITQKILKELLRYNPISGLFYKAGTSTAVTGSLTKGYVHIFLLGKKRYAHRLAWLYMHGAFPKESIDHINGIKTDNRLCNIRSVSQLENGRNSKKSIANKSGFTGVHWRCDVKKWRVQIHVDGKNKSLGYYEALSDAIAARVRGNKKFGYHNNHGRTEC